MTYNRDKGIMKKKLLCILVLLLMLNACGDERVGPDSQPPYNDSYIQGFVPVSNISVSTGVGLKIDFENKITLFKESYHLEKKDYYPVSDGIQMWIEGVYSEKDAFFSRGLAYSTHAYVKYTEYTDLLGDNGFKEKRRYYGVLCEQIASVAIIDTLESIKVTCDKDFSDALPTGSNISGLFTVFYDNPYLVVKNGYRNYTGEDAFRDDYMVQGFPYAFIGNKLSSVDFTKKPFIGNIWLLYLNEAPDKTDTYTFTVEVTKTDGTVLEAKADPLNIDGKIDHEK